MNLRIKAENEINDLDRKILGCMAVSGVTPMRFIVQPDKTIAIYVGRRLITQMDISLFAQLEPHEILKTIGVPINDQAAKY